MPKGNIPLKSRIVNIKLISAKPSFLMYPLPLLRIGHKFKWKARFIVGTGYLYALAFNGQEAKTSYRELAKVLSTNSISRVQEFLAEIETLNRYVFSVVGSKHPEKFVRTSKNGTEIELILPQDFSLIEENRAVGFFPVPKVAFLMPTSAQAKALYVYLHYLKSKDNPTVITSANRLGKDLRLDRKRVKKYLSELEEINAISFESSRNSLKIIVKTPLHWKEETFVKIVELYGEEHPFMKDWKLERCTNRPQPGVPIDPNQNSGSKRNPKPKNASTTSIITTSNTTSIYDDIYINNGGGEKNNITNSSNTKKQIKKTNNNHESSQKLTCRNTASSYKKPNGFKNKKGAGELGEPNNRAGRSKLEERVDQQELEKIKKALSRISPDVKRLLDYYRVKVDEELYKPLKEIYGESWETLAGMYELFDRKEPRFGYNRKVNTNYLGLLLSFVLRDSRASFWELYERFIKVFGVKVEEETTTDDTLLCELKEFLKEKLPKPVIYRIFVRDGIKQLEDRGEIRVLKVKDRVVAEFLSKNLAQYISEILGKNWRMEY